jgi:hypothetical protein
MVLFFLLHIFLTTDFTDFTVGRRGLFYFTTFCFGRLGMVLSDWGFLHRDISICVYTYGVL